MKKYKVIKDDNGNIAEAHALGFDGIPEYRDADGNQIMDYDEEKDEFVSLPETSKIREDKRKRNVISGIKKEFSVDDEIRLIKKAIQAIITRQDIPTDYIEMENKIQKIKSAFS